MKKNFKRREFIKKAGLAGAAATAISSFPAPAIAAGHQEWIICSAFGKAGLLTVFIVPKFPNFVLASSRDTAGPATSRAQPIFKMKSMQRDLAKYGGFPR